MTGTATVTGTSARRKARKRAVDVLYEADLRGGVALDVLAERVISADPPVPPYAVDLVEGVAAHRTDIDELIAGHAQGWTLDRMPPVDRNILRVAVYELRYRDDVDAAVAISEAVELAKSLSTEDSPKFINGLLGTLAE